MAVGLSGSFRYIEREGTLPMARLNTTLLVLQVTDVGFRVDQVQRDPAVRKAWAEAGSDTRRAVTSIGRAASETRSAWHRTQPGGATGASTTTT
jgi:hypothetical protein